MHNLSTRNWALRSPLFDAPLELGRLFGSLDGLTLPAAPAAPRCNIEEVDENAYCIHMEVPGFERKDIEISHHGNILTVSGQTEAEDAEEEAGDEDEAKRKYLHRGFSRQSFSRQFNLADHVRVDKATLANGILDVRLIREIPEEAKPKLVSIEEA